MAVVWIPPLLRELCGGQQKVEVQGKTLGQVVTNLEKTYPGMEGRICDGDRIRPELAVAIDGELAQMGLLAPVGGASEIHILPAIGGGAT